MMQDRPGAGRVPKAALEAGTVRWPPRSTTTKEYAQSITLHNEAPEQVQTLAMKGEIGKWIPPNLLRFALTDGTRTKRDNEVSQATSRKANPLLVELLG